MKKRLLKCSAYVILICLCLSLFSCSELPEKEPEESADAGNAPAQISYDFKYSEFEPLLKAIAGDTNDALSTYDYDDCVTRISDMQASFYKLNHVDFLIHNDEDILNATLFTFSPDSNTVTAFIEKDESNLKITSYAKTAYTIDIAKETEGLNYKTRFYYNTDVIVDMYDATSKSQNNKYTLIGWLETSLTYISVEYTRDDDKQKYDSSLSQGFMETSLYAMGHTVVNSKNSTFIVHDACAFPTLKALLNKNEDQVNLYSEELHKNHVTDHFTKKSLITLFDKFYETEFLANDKLCADRPSGDNVSRVYFRYDASSASHIIYRMLYENSDVLIYTFPYELNDTAELLNIENDLRERCIVTDHSITIDGTTVPLLYEVPYYPSADNSADDAFSGPPIKQGGGVFGIFFTAEAMIITEQFYDYELDPENLQLDTSWADSLEFYSVKELCGDETVTLDKYNRKMRWINLYELQTLKRLLDSSDRAAVEEYLETIKFKQQGFMFSMEDVEEFFAEYGDIPIIVDKRHNEPQITIDETTGMIMTSYTTQITNRFFSYLKDAVPQGFGSQEEAIADILNASENLKSLGKIEFYENKLDMYYSWERGRFAYTETDDVYLVMKFYNDNESSNFILTTLNELCSADAGPLDPLE